MEYIVSVDGGGTKTMFLATDLRGNPKGTVEVGCSNYKSVGVDGIFCSFRAGLEQLQSRFGITAEEIAYSVWGISGCDSGKDYRIILEQILKTGCRKEHVFLCNDGLLAYYAQASGPGVVVIAGTGSVVLGVGKDRKIYRSGGWGYNISDIGSGYWIGSRALEQTLLYCDGCLPYAMLYDAVREYFREPDFANLPFIITGLTDNYKIAETARLVVELAGEGEERSRQILRDGAAVLAKMAANVYRRLGLSSEDESHIVFSGGVLKSENYQTVLKSAIFEELGYMGYPVEQAARIRFAVQKREPVYGGVCLAKWLWEEADGE